MKKASIISIGNEILSGQRVDTNAAYLSRHLVSVGIPVVAGYKVADEIDCIVETLRQATSQADVILITGGLGPTDDDLTRQALARFVGSDLEPDETALRDIKNFYAKRKLHMPERNKVQSLMPAGAKALPNSLGTAPGILAEWEGKLVFAMPGVPSEMKQMFEKLVLPKLRAFACKQVVAVRKIKCFGTGESNIAEMLGELMERGRNPLINITANHGVITLYIIAKADNQEKAGMMVERDESLLRSILGELVYGVDEQTLAEVVGEKLVQQGKSVAVGESCTGGLIAKELTDVPGASKYFQYGWVVYSNAAKTKELGVDGGLIEEYGAVSEEVAQAMARGAKVRAGSDFAIGATGIAGPRGGSEQKPVGLVYISVYSDNIWETKRFLFGQDRASIRFRAAMAALNMLRLKL